MNYPPRHKASPRDHHTHDHCPGDEDQRSALSHGVNNTPRHRAPQPPSTTPLGKNRNPGRHRGQTRYAKIRRKLQPAISFIRFISFLYRLWELWQDWEHILNALPGVGS